MTAPTEGTSWAAGVSTGYRLAGLSSAEIAKMAIDHATYGGDEIATDEQRNAARAWIVGFIDGEQLSRK